MQAAKQGRAAPCFYLLQLPQPQPLPPTHPIHPPHPTGAASGLPCCRVSGMRAKLGASGGGAKTEQKLDSTIRILSHKEAKLKGGCLPG